MFRRALAEGSGYFGVAEIESTPVGFAEVVRGGDAPPFTVAARVAIGAMGIVGALRAGWKEFARRAHLAHNRGGQPARRLYDRCGYRVEAEKVDARYEGITGSPGRVLMVKPVSPRP